MGNKEDAKTDRQKLILDLVVGVTLVPALVYTGTKADKKPAWRMLLREYLALLFFLAVMAIRAGHDKFHDFTKLFGFAGCLFIIFNIYMTVRIIIDANRT